MEQKCRAYIKKEQMSLVAHTLPQIDEQEFKEKNTFSGFTGKVSLLRNG